MLVEEYKGYQIWEDGPENFMITIKGKYRAFCEFTTSVEKARKIIDNNIKRREIENA